MSKRYTCTNCPYSTDRRDLFTRHENIHKEEKPFHCYVCLKQFNRADHVKKHFLRMHRGLVYDITRTKRLVASPPSKKTNSTTPSSNYYQHQSQHQSSGGHQLTTLNIPTAFASSLHQPPSLINPPGSNQAPEQTVASDLNMPAPHQQQPAPVTIKTEKLCDKSAKKKNDKRFVCCYCTWTGSDNWGLKRHLNTHTKPFVCMLCDYKAARSERLSTHILKVHNKKVCTKCNYLADNQDEFDTHVFEAQ